MSTMELANEVFQIVDETRQIHRRIQIVSGDNYEAMLAERVLRLATVVETLVRRELEKESAP
jgi:hypothetical protein